MIYLTSDTHFSHYNIIKYCNRPFYSAKEMNEVLIANWNSTVSPEDTIFHLGDFALTKREESAEIISRLNGYKILIRGNHDRSLQVMKELGFDEVYNEYQYEGWLLKHHPERAESGIKQLAGHVHEKWSRIKDVINVGVDVRHFKPHTLEQLLNWENDNANL